MATITVRVDDETRDLLQEKAQSRGDTLSDLIRDLLREAVVPVREERATPREFAPESLDPKDRQMFALLHRILGRVLPEDSNDVDGDLAYQLERARVLEAGYTHEYGMEFIGIEPELSARDCARVMDILDMFRIAEYSIAHLEKDGVPVDSDVADDLRYGGFDLNDPLEGQMASYVQYLVQNDRWTERAEFIEKTDGGNSHSPMLEQYTRMVAEYRRIKDARRRARIGDYLLSADELRAIAESSIHPSNRAPR